MLHSCIFLFILAGVLHSSNCLQRSDYIYDRETRMVTLTTNRTTYTCRASDIIYPAMDRAMKSFNGPCLYGEESVDDPNCIRVEFIKIFTEAMQEAHKEGEPSSCAAPIPSVEETLDRIEKVYRSSSLDDNPATKEWAKEALENVTRLKTECEANGTRRLYPETLGKAAQLVIAGFAFGHTQLLELRGNVSEAQTVLEEAKGVEAGRRALWASLPAYVENDFHDIRESLFVTEVTALGDSYESELYTWNQLAEARKNFVNVVSAQKKLKHSHSELKHELTLATQRVVEAEMDMLSKMAQANEMLARIEYIKREVEYNLENACETILPNFDYIGI